MWARSSARSEHWPFKPVVAGSNPVGPAPMKLCEILPETKELERFFKESDLGGFGGELPLLLADIIVGVRTGVYSLGDEISLLQQSKLAKMGLTAEQARDYMSDTSFPEYVVKVCQKMYPSDVHAPAFIQIALNDFVKDKKCILK